MSKNALPETSPGAPENESNEVATGVENLYPSEADQTVCPKLFATDIRDIQISKMSSLENSQSRCGSPPQSSPMFSSMNCAYGQPDLAHSQLNDGMYVAMSLDCHDYKSMGWNSPVFVFQNLIQIYI